MGSFFGYIPRRNVGSHMWYVGSMLRNYSDEIRLLVICGLATSLESMVKMIWLCTLLIIYWVISESILAPLVWYINDLIVLSTKIWHLHLDVDTLICECFIYGSLHFTHHVNLYRLQRLHIILYECDISTYSSCLLYFNSLNWIKTVYLGVYTAIHL